MVLYPDGSVARQTKTMLKGLITPRYLVDMLSLRKAMAPQNRLALLHRVAHTALADEGQRWADNISDAISGLSGPQTALELDRIMSMADWSRVGLVGMSLGGSASASAAHMDSRVHVAVNLDGMQQGGSLLDTAIRVPILVMHGRQALSADGTAFTRYHYQSSNVNDADTPVRRWLVRGANHFDFTDMTAFGRGPVRAMLHLGRIDGELMLGATAALVKDFIDVHLRGAEPSNEQSTIARYHCLIPI